MTAKTDPLLTRTFVLLSAAHFLHALSYHLFLHLPGFLTSIGASEFDVGMLSGAASFAAIAARPPIGGVMDHRGRMPIVWAGGALSVVACCCYFAVGSLGVGLYAVRIMHGLSEAMLFASLFAFAADIVPASRRIEGIGLFGVSGMLPMAVAGALGDWVLRYGSYRALFGVALASTGVALVLSFFLVEPTRALHGERPRGLGSALIDRSLLPIWLGALCFATAIAAHFSFLKTFVLERPIANLGDFFATYAVAACALRVLFGRVPEAVGPKRVLVGALLALAAGHVLLAFAAARWHVIVAGALAGSGHGWSFPILLGLVVERARASERGSALAIYTALFDGGTMIGGPVLGAVIETWGYTTMFLVAASMVGLGLCVVLLGDRRIPAVTDRRDDGGGVVG